MESKANPSNSGRLEIDLTKHELYRNGFPHDLFRDLRKRGYVQRHPRVKLRLARDEMDFWAVLGHPEVTAMTRDWETFSSIDGPTITGVPEMRGQALPFTDPPQHTRMRKLISAGFTPRALARLDALIAKRTKDILDAVAERGECDFVDDIAALLPMHLIADIVGIPESERPYVFDRTARLLWASDPTSGITQDEQALIQIEIYQYAEKLSAEKRKNPVDDIWSTLTVAETEDENGDKTRLTDFELNVFFLILSIAGSETTRNVMSQGLLALLQFPDQLAALRANPNVLETGADEMIRWASPVTSFTRTCTRDTELGGQQIKAGERVVMWYPSANRDERVFEDADRLNLARKPNPQVAFGGPGPHFCLGAHLARREIRSLFEQIVARFGEIEVTGKPSWSVAGPETSVGVSLNHVPVRMRAR